MYFPSTTNCIISSYLVGSVWCVDVLTVAQLPGDVVLLASTVLQEAQGGGGVPGVVWVSVQ